ncbi:Creatinase/aminopeptidase [Crepidotus variabilis]|uniref:Creatinase/aminopeptidase n=1 Tax=Crepidotus variabilis TaxID=179855 RepID=A0A9P6JST6_9AGAR|nr:Creatinase/aminopeptidase [Crepidotus variabilis]
MAIGTGFGGPFSHQFCLEQLGSHCALVPPISQEEYVDRQQRLVEVLYGLGGAAYIAEPGANTQFFANFSKAQWPLSERPLLLMISPMIKNASESDKVLPKITIVTPKFESARAKLLSIPHTSGLEVDYVEWAEEADPYAITLGALPLFGRDGSLYVESSIRKFIPDGLSRANSHVVVLSAPSAITSLRERKSDTEIVILKCVNEATLLAIREVYHHLYFGIRESQARSMMTTALSAAGLKDGGCLTLFGENAALPHGRGTDKTLHRTDFALFDCTASLHGYYSDVTRTVALDFEWLSEEQLSAWTIVKSVQADAFSTAKNGTRTGYVDERARTLMRFAGGYDKYFTHRLGHGIGLEVHEEPYLRGNSDSIILTGHTFSNEPGIYIEDQFGVRLEDCFYMAANGSAIYLTGGVGGPARAPWAP